MMALNYARLLAGLCLLAGWTGVGTAQMDAAGGNGAPMAMGSGRMVRGTVTSAAADHLTVKTETGELYQVLITPNTQVRKGRDPMKIADVHAGDGVGAMGEMEPAKKVVHALMVVVVDAEQIRKAREAMGKTVIAGTVTAINETKLTIKRTDDVVQVIEVDEDTSFRKGGRGMGAAFAADGMGPGMFGGGGGGGGRGQRPEAAATAENGESVTLADVKVGSVVAGQGSMKHGSFVPTVLAISEPGAQRQRRRNDGAGNENPASPKPGTEPKQ
jgi:hypothetical protein